MLPKTEQLRLGVADVPDGYTPVYGASDQQVFVEGRVVHTHYFGDMGLDRLADLQLAFVPNFEFFIVGHARKLIDVKLIPSHVLHHLRVRIPLDQRVDCRRELVGLVDVPQTNFIIVAAR